MKIKGFLLSAVFLILIVWVATCLAMNQVPVQEHSRRMNTDPEYLKKRTIVLRLYSEGRTALYHKNYVLAEKKFRQSLALDDLNGDIGTWADLGRALDEQGRSEEAYGAYRNAYDSPTRGGYSNFSNDVETLTHYGVMCEDHGQHEAAVRAYNKAVEELNPKPTEVPLSVSADPNATSEEQLRALLNVVRGLTMGEEKNLPGGMDRKTEALEIFQEAAQEQPNDARVQYYLGYGLQEAGMKHAAQAAYQKAARLDTEGAVKAAVTKNLREINGSQ